jgi:mitochondrial intermediate peptidase
LGIPYASGTHWHSRFGHVVTYGAGYYGYLYAQVFANDIWRSLFAGRPLDAASGQQLWHKVLRHGGAKDPSEMLTDLLGRPPQVDSFG